MTFGFPELNVEAARAIPIAEVAGRYTSHLRRAGHDLVGPCPVCGGDDRFAVHPRKGIWLCRGCEASGGAIDLVMHVEGVPFREAVEILIGDEGGVATPPSAFDRLVERSRRAAEDAEADRKRIASAVRIWGQTEPAGALVRDYLGRHRGLDLGRDLDDTIRFHPSCPFGEAERHPCMVAPMTNVLSGEITGVHRTRLDPATAAKVGRRMLGVVADAAIMLDAATDDLTVAEGIESAMSSRVLGLRPAWATGSAGGMARLPIVEGVRHLRLCEEQGDDGVSARAVLSCAERWHAADSQTTVIRPPAGCSDLNDIHRSR